MEVVCRFIVGLVFLVGCSSVTAGGVSSDTIGSGSASYKTGPSPVLPSATPTSITQSVSQEIAITITATPGMRYNDQSPGQMIKVPLGAWVRVIFINSDSLQHDWWVVEAEEKAPYVAPAFKGARTKVIEADAKEETSFIADRPGTFKYICTVPGHDSVMYGVFIVEGK